MTDIRKLAEKHAKGFVDPRVKAAIVHALQELKKRVVLDVTVSDPDTNLVAQRIVRGRAMPYPRASYPGANISARIEYLDIVRYAVEMGRQLERQAQAGQVEHEFGWHWSGAPHKVFPIFGAVSIEAARAIMANGAVAEGQYEIVVRTHVRPGHWSKP